VEDDSGEGRLPEKAVSGRASLADLCAEYALFTSALVELFGRFQRDLVQEHINLTSPPPEVFWLELPRPLFAALERGQDPSLNFTLNGCALAAWPALRRHVASAALLERDRKSVYSVFYHLLRVPDVLALERMSVLPPVVPEVEITVFGVATPTQAVGLWRKPGMGELAIPALQPALESDRLMAAAALADRPFHPSILEDPWPRVAASEDKVA